MERIGVGCNLGAYRTVGEGMLEIGDYVTIEDNVVLDLSGFSGALIRLGDRVKLKTGVVVRTYGGSVEIGERTSIGEYTVIYGHGGVRIGPGCGIGPHCSIHASSHIVASDIPIRFQGETAKGCHMDEGVWLGAGARILDGVTVGRNSAIGANAVVTRDVPSETVAVGVPARAVGRTGYRTIRDGDTE